MFAITFAVVLSASTASVIGSLFRTSIRLGPIIVGVGLGISISLIALPIIEIIIHFLTPFVFGVWIISIFIAVGGLFGAYLGFR